MNKSEAKNILIKSINNHKLVKENISYEDFEPNLINLACLSILKKQKELNYSGSLFPYEFQRKAISAFNEAAMELFPGKYTHQHAVINDFGIQQNLHWEGIREFLKNYFLENHKISIDDLRDLDFLFSEALVANSIPIKDLPKYSINDFNVFVNFNEKWHSSINRKEKTSISVHSDYLINLGVDEYEMDNILEAINYYQKTLEIMPNNDAALKNLRICYSEIGRQDMSFEMFKRINYLGI